MGSRISRCWPPKRGLVVTTPVVTTPVVTTPEATIVSTTPVVTTPEATIVSKKASVTIDESLDPGVDHANKLQNQVIRVKEQLVRQLQERKMTEVFLHLVCDQIHNTLIEQDNVAERSFRVMTMTGWQVAEKGANVGEGLMCQSLQKLQETIHRQLRHKLAAVDGGLHPMLLDVKEAFADVTESYKKESASAVCEAEPADDDTDDDEEGLEIVRHDDDEHESAFIPTRARGVPARARAQQLLESVHAVFLRMPEDWNQDLGIDMKLKNRIANAWVGVAAGETSGVAAPTARIAFIGAESVGKSTLINFTVDPGGDGADLLPTGVGMVTQTICLVKDGNFTSVCTHREEPTQSMSPFDLRQKIENESDKIHQNREKGVASDDNEDLSKLTFFKVQKQFTGKLKEANVQLIDVPGYKPDRAKIKGTEFEMYLALGLCTHVVLCAPEPNLLKRQLENGELSRIPTVIAEVAKDWNVKHLPVFIVATRCTYEQFKAGRKAYEKILRDKFKMPKEHAAHCVLFGNCYEMRKSGQQSRIQGVITNMLNGFKKVKPNKAGVWDIMEILREPCEQSVKDLEKVAGRQMNAKMNEFQSRKAQATDKLLEVSEALSKNETRQKDEEQVKEAMKDAVPKPEDVPVFKYMSEGKVQHALGSERVLISENLMLETRLAFMNGVVDATGSMFITLWDSFAHFAWSSTGKKKDLKHAKQFMNCVDYTAKQLPPPQPLSKFTMKEWQFTSCSELNQCCSPANFGYFAAGYHLACIDKHMKEVLLSEFVHGTAMNQEIKRDDIVQFPMIERGEQNPATLAETLTLIHREKLQGWVSALASAKEQSADAFTDATISAVFESAEVAVEAVEHSTAFSNDNPFVTKMIEFSFGMLQRLFMEFRADNGTAQFVFTPFTDYLQTEKNKGSMKYVVDAIKKVRQSGQTEFAEKVEALGHGVEVLKHEISKRNALVPKALEFITDLEREGTGAVSQARLQLEKTSEEIAGDSVFVACTVGPVIPGEVLDTFSTELSDRINALNARGKMVSFASEADTGDADTSSEPPLATITTVSFQTRSNVTPISQVDEMSEALLPSLWEAKPNIIVLARDCSVMSGSLNSHEQELFESISAMPTVGLVIWVTSQHNPIAVAGGKQECVEVETGSSAYNIQDLLFEAGGKPQDKIVQKIHQKHSEVKSILQDEQDRAKEALQSSIHRATGVLKQYTEYKEKIPLITDLHKRMDQLRGLRDKKLNELASCDELRIVLPQQKFLKEEPFVTNAKAVHLGGKTLSAVNEIKMREFLFKAILSQLINFARKRGEQIFTQVVEPVIRDMAGEWNLRADDLMQHIENYKINHSGQKDKKISQKEQKKIMHMTAFLTRERFTIMYIGGTIMALVPLIRAVVMAKLRHRVDGPDDVNEHDYETKKEDAERHFKMMHIAAN